MFARIKNAIATVFALVMLCAPLSVQATGYDPNSSTAIPVNVQLYPGTSISSPDGRFSLNFQASDRNLVLYQGGTALWSAKTNKYYCTTPPGAPQCTPPQTQYIIFQSDGNLVAYDQYTHGWGISNTAGYPNSTLALQNDGNLVIYDSSNHAIWATNTCCH